MDLELTNISDTYKYLLNQSGSTPITLGDNSPIDWNVGGAVALTGNQIISGTKKFTSDIDGNAITATTATIVINGVYTDIDNTINGSVKSRNLLISGNNTNAYVKNTTLSSGNLYLGANNSDVITITTQGQVLYKYSVSTLPNYDPLADPDNIELQKYPVKKIILNDNSNIHRLSTTVPANGARSTLIIGNSGAVQCSISFESGFRVGQYNIPVSGGGSTLCEFVSADGFMYLTSKNQLPFHN